MHNPPYERLLASAARTATTNTATLGNHESRGVLLYFNVTSITSTPSLTPTVQFSPDGGTTWVDYCAFTAVTSATDNTYLIYPVLDASAAGSADAVIALPLPRIWRVSIVAADSDSATYALDVVYL
jgi:hypothetical protein